MFIVIYDPPAADNLARFMSGHGYRARKRTPFVVEIDASGAEADVDRLFVEWHEGRDEIPAELITPPRLQSLTRA